MKGFLTIIFAGICCYALIILWPAPAEKFQPLERETPATNYAFQP